MVISDAGIPAPSTARRAVDRHPLAAFITLAYLISWAWWVPFVASGATVRQGVGWPTQISGLMGPAIAAFIVTWMVGGRDGMKRLWSSIIAWRIGWWWLAVPVILVAGAVGIAISSDDGLVAADLTAYNGVSVALGAVLTVVIVFVCNGIGEEAGWRGFAVARLVDRSLVVTSLIVTLMWAPWHLPLFFLMESFKAFSAFEIVGWVIGLTAGSFVLTWLFRGSGGSVLLVAAWHTAFNFTSATPATSGAAAAITSTLVMIVAVAIVIVEWHIRRVHRTVRRFGAVDRPSMSRG